MSGIRRKQQSAMKHAYRLFDNPGMEGGPTPTPTDELDESDVWAGYEAESRGAEFRKAIPALASRASSAARNNTPNNKKKGDRVVAGSLPVNIPDWSKILREEYRGGNSYDSSRVVLAEVDEDEEEETGAVIPPHELLWKKRAASLSVQEGIGRTLKGRDLSRVRNAIWEKTGFQD